MANEFVIKNGLISNGDGQIDNNLNVTGQIDATSGLILNLGTDDFDSGGIDKKTGAQTLSINPDRISPFGLSIIKIQNDGLPYTASLLDGVSGQRLTIYVVAEGSPASGATAIQPSSSAGYTTISLGDIGESVDLIYDNSFGWVITSSKGVTIS